MDINRNFKLALKAEYFGYSTDDEAEAWNLPDIEASLFLDYQIDEHWFAGANLFFVGERKDQFAVEQSFLPVGLPKTITLDSFFDINAHVGYKINSQLSAFAKANEGKFLDRWSKSGSIITKLEGENQVVVKIDGKYWMYWGEQFINLAWSENLYDWYPSLDDMGELQQQILVHC